MATTALRHTPAPICLPLSPRTHDLQVEGSSLAQDTVVPSPEPLSSAVLLHELLLPHLTNDGVAAGAAVIARLALVCRSLKSLAHDDEAVWRPLCEAFAQRTQPSQWLDHGDHAANDGHGAPRLYRQLFPLLLQHADLIGVWQTPPNRGGGGHGGVYLLTWAQGGVKVARLQPAASFLTTVHHESLGVLRPGSRHLTAELLDDGRLLLRDARASIKHCSRSNRPPSAAAAAATAVAVGAGSLIHSSDARPSSGFAYELMRFMSTSVVKQTRSTRRHRRAAGSCADAPQPVLHTLCRVPSCPLRGSPSRRHPLAGLWKGLLLPPIGSGCVLFSLVYDFTGPSARILARVLTGDAGVPVGCALWAAAAAPLPLPWSDDDAALVEARPLLLTQARDAALDLADADAADAAAGDVIAAIMQQEPPPAEALERLQSSSSSSSSHATTAAAGGGLDASSSSQQGDAAAVDVWVDALRQRTVANVHVGVGSFGPRPTSVRLMVYQDGSCGVVFLLGSQSQPGARACLCDLERLGL